MSPIRKSGAHARCQFHPDWKVYNHLGSFMAATKHPADAAILVAAWGPGAKIKYKHHTTVWTEGKEEFRAGESYDQVAALCYKRAEDARREAQEKFEKEQIAARTQ